jgi:hypothetical protein
MYWFRELNTYVIKILVFYFPLIKKIYPKCSSLWHDFVTQQNVEKVKGCEYFLKALYAKQKTLIAKLNKPYNSMHNDYFKQFPQIFLQNHIYLKNSADVKFHKRMIVKSPSDLYVTKLTKNCVKYLLWMKIQRCQLCFWTGTNLNQS